MTRAAARAERRAARSRAALRGQAIARCVLGAMPPARIERQCAEVRAVLQRLERGASAQELEAAAAALAEVPRDRQGTLRLGRGRD